MFVCVIIQWKQSNEVLTTKVFFSIMSNWILHILSIFPSHTLQQQPPVNTEQRNVSILDK
jgi:hypothetical protein